MKLDELLTISEALEQLKKETGVAWTEAAFLSAAYEIGIELQALPPITAGVDEPAGYAMDASGKLCPVTRKQWRMASLKSSNIKRLLLSGEALVHEAVKREKIHDKDYIQSLVEISEYFTSPVQVSCEMVRVPVGVINELTSCTETWPTTPTPMVPPARGIGKRKVMAAFQGIKWDYDHWGKNLASPSDKLKACRIVQGNKKASALWNPADIGLYLLDEGEKLKTLDVVFVDLNDWSVEWKEKTRLERD